MIRSRLPRLLLALACCAALLATVVAPVSARVTALELDPTFGNSGKVLINAAFNAAEAAAVVVQSDGKVVVAGTLWPGSNTASEKIALLRYLSNGGLDSSFGQGGVAITDITEGADHATAMALQSDGRIVVAGYATTAILARYNGDGSLDASFGAAGKQITALPPATTLALQSDSKIVLGGSAGGNFYVARLNYDGSIDTNFGSAGMTTTDFTGFSDAVTALAVQSNGSIVAVGSANTTGSAPFNANLAVARYLSSGALDSKFAQGGKLTTSFVDGHSSEKATAVGIAADGKIVAGGSGDHGVIMLRLNPNGSLDSGFGGSGKAMPSLGNNPSLNALALLPDGKIMGGGSGHNLTDDFLLFRLNGDGSPDSGFSSTGFVNIDFAGATDVGRALAMQPDGKAVIAGSAGNIYSEPAFGVARYDTLGNADSGFGSAGKVTTQLPDGTEVASAFAVQSDGKLVTAGLSEGHWTVTRNNADGSPDNSFGINGRALYLRPVGPQTSYLQPPLLAIEPNNEILIAGLWQYTACNGLNCTAYSQNSVARIAQSGALSAYIDLPLIIGSTAPEVGALLAQPDGKILVMTKGDTSPVYRYNFDGSADTGFGSNGVASASVSGSALAVQPDGKILAGGAVGGDFGLQRLGAQGLIDSNFGTGGRVTTDFAGGADRISGLAVQADGKIVAVGQPGFKLARYNSNGSLDTSLGGSGKIASGLEQANAVALTPANILVAGFNLGDFVVAAYKPDGSLDSNFGTNGILSVDFAGSDDKAVGLGVQSSGRIVVGGNATTAGNKDFALARYAPLPFADVTPSNPFYSFIHKLWYSGTIEGQSATSFGWNYDATRADLARWIVRARGWAIDLHESPHFSDVPTTDPNYQYIETAFNHYVLSGYAPADCPGGVAACFKPANSLTRGQMSKIIVNAMGWFVETPAQPHFNDVPANNPFYGQIETIYRRGLVSGYDAVGGGFEFRWGAYLTRGQLSKVLSNAIDAGAPTTNKPGATTKGNGGKP